MNTGSHTAWIPIVGSLILSAPTLADVTSSAAADPNGLEEIVVTAQRRSENLEHTPVSVAVLGSAALAEQAIVTESDLRTAVPGLSVRSTTGSNDLNYSIRGQTVDAFSGSNPAVLPYFNEVQVAGHGSTSAFYDLQSIQVLKGPQGTLFGRNTTGGAVLFTSQKPDDSLDGYITVRGGNYAERQVEGALNVPIVPDTVLARVAGYYEKRDGFQYNTLTNSTVGAVDRFGLRASLTVKFSEKIKNDLVVDFAHAGGSSTSLVITSVAPVGSNSAPIPANLIYSPALDAVLNFPGAWAAYLAGNPRAPFAGLTAEPAIQKARGPFTISINNPLAHLSNNLLLSDIFTVDIVDDLQFKNVFGYTRLSSRDGDDADGSVFGIDGATPSQAYLLNHNDLTYSEEPQLIGKAFHGNLSYIAGAYFSNEKLYDLQDSQFLDLEPLAPPESQNNNTLGRDKTYAGYGQGTYDLTQATGVPGLSASAGARYTSEKVSMTQLPGSTFYFDPAVAPFQNELANTFNKVSWQIGLQDQINSSTLLYVVSRRSFRSGGFNTLTPPLPGNGDQGGAGFDAETATDVELGVKFQGNLGTMPARLNIAAYDDSIKNIQRSVFTVVAGAPASVTVNVPKTRVTGVEVDGQINPLSWLKFGTSFSYLNAVFTSNHVTLPGTPPLSVSFGPSPDAPRWSGTVYSEVNVPVTADLELSIRGDLYDQTVSYYSSTNNTLTPGSALPAYAVANFRVGLGSTKAGWSVAALVKNAFNRVYYVGGLATLNVFDVNSSIPGDPRTFMGEVTYKF